MITKAVLILLLSNGQVVHVGNSVDTQVCHQQGNTFLGSHLYGDERVVTAYECQPTRWSM
jgi:hypothetical protein